VLFRSQKCTTKLGFNLEEADFSDWEDRKTKNIVVSAQRISNERVSRFQTHDG
jgi:hypothetical protein